MSLLDPINNKHKFDQSFLIPISRDNDQDDKPPPHWLYLLWKWDIHKFGSSDVYLYLLFIKTCAFSFSASKQKLATSMINQFALLQSESHFQLSGQRAINLRHLNQVLIEKEDSMNALLSLIFLRETSRGSGSSSDAL